MVSFADLTESDVLSEFFGLTQELTKVLVTLADVDGEQKRPLYSDRQKNPLCRLVQSCAAGMSACDEAERATCREVAQSRGIANVKCFCGALNAGVPVFDGDTHVATLLCGQILPEPPSEHGFQALREACEDLVLPTAELRAAYYRSPFLAGDKLDQTLRLLSLGSNGYSQMLGEVRFAENRRRRATIEGAKQYIQAHFREALRLEEVAAQVGLSPAYFSTLFKKTSGEAFCHYVQRLRIDEAKRLLNTTNETVTAISRQVGFNSLTHFTRVFYRFENCAPGRFRK